IDDVLSRITLPGAIFLTIVAMLPIVVSNVLNMPFGFGGTALLIVVGVALDTVQQVQQHLLLRHYDGFMRGGGPGAGTSRVRFRARLATPHHPLVGWSEEATAGLQSTGQPVAPAQLE